jgi:hypothetical protein
MITKGESSYNQETFQVEYELIHRIKVTDEWMNIIGNKEDLIKIMTEIYSKHLENYLNKCLRSSTD